MDKEEGYVSDSDEAQRVLEKMKALDALEHDCEVTKKLRAILKEFNGLTSDEIKTNLKELGQEITGDESKDQKSKAVQAVVEYLNDVTAMRESDQFGYREVIAAFAFARAQEEVKKLAGEIEKRGDELLGKKPREEDGRQ